MIKLNIYAMKSHSQSIARGDYTETNRRNANLNIR